MKIILSGYMGSGKTVVGKLLQEKLQLPFLDLDMEISKKENKSIPAIFEQAGEIYFRRKESEILSELLNSEEDFLLALGGGTPCYGKNLQFIKDHPEAKLFYLKASIDTLKKRLFEERGERPLIAHLDSPELLEDFIRKHLFERAFYYNQSEYIVKIDGQTPEEVAAAIIDRLN
ncbi:MAG: shikimate kinase [Salinimicrobium sp.]